MPDYRSLAERMQEVADPAYIDTMRRVGRMRDPRNAAGPMGTGGLSAADRALLEQMMRREMGPANPVTGLAGGPYRIGTGIGP